MNYKLFLASLNFFLILFSYYVIRPIRDEMGVMAGIDKIDTLFFSTLIFTTLLVPTFALIFNYFKRELIACIINLFVALNLLIFYFLFEYNFPIFWLATSYFIWLSVINLFIISVFWSTMADIYDEKEAKISYGYIAAAGSVGALIGPTTTALLVPYLGISKLFLLAGLTFTVSAVVSRKLILLNKLPDLKKVHKNYISSDLWSGINSIIKNSYLRQICLFIVIQSVVTTIVYIFQISVVKQSIDSSIERTSLFAWIDTSVNLLTILFQVFITKRVFVRYGLFTGLALLPFLSLIGFSIATLYQTLALVVLFQVLIRVISYSITRPSREMLFSIVPTEDKYKSKNAIDTLVYRTGDALTAWVLEVVRNMTGTITSCMLLGIAVSVYWLRISKKLAQIMSKNESSH